MKTLEQLASQYRTDKHPSVKHHYIDFYENLFQNREKEIKKVLEIGIGSASSMQDRKYRPGASLRMWRDYFPQATIYGLDNDPTTLFQVKRIQTFLGDQHRRADLEKLIQVTGSDLDLVIDDGDHRPESQIGTCLTLMTLLGPQVVYCIEDVGHREIADQIAQQAGLRVQVHRFSPSRWHDDCIVEVRHG